MFAILPVLQLNIYLTHPPQLGTVLVVISNYHSCDYHILDYVLLLLILTRHTFKFLYLCLVSSAQTEFVRFHQKVLLGRHLFQGRLHPNWR